MFLTYHKMILVDPKEVKIHYEDKDDFWLHHGRREEEKEYLRHLAHILPSVIEKKLMNLQLTDEEKYSYEIFVVNGPVLSYDWYSKEYEVTDGRHRMYMLREENIHLEMCVCCCIDTDGLIEQFKNFIKSPFDRNAKLISKNRYINELIIPKIKVIKDDPNNHKYPIYSLFR